MRGVRRRALLVGIFVLSALPLLGGSPASAGSSAVFSIDSARVTVGGSSEARLRITADAPGVAGFHLNLNYDPTKILVTGCEPAHTCNFDVTAPNTVRFVSLMFGGYKGEDIPVGTLKFQSVGGLGSTTLSIDKSSIFAAQPDTLPIENVETRAGVVSIVGTVMAGDLDCNGSLTMADVMAALSFAATGKIVDKAGCTPTGNVVDGKIWGDQDNSGAIDGRDALNLLLQAAN